MPFFWRRLQTAPWSIKVAVGVAGLWFALAALGFAWEAVQLNAYGENPRMSGWLAQLALCGYAIVATSRMGRWPLAIVALVIAAEFVGFLLGASSGLYPLIHGVSFAGFAALVGPHWRRMNWRPFGEEPPVEPRLEDLFE